MVSGVCISGIRGFGREYRCLHAASVVFVAVLWGCSISLCVSFVSLKLTMIIVMYSNEIDIYEFM